MLDIENRLAIYELLALYGHIIDDRQWSRIEELFTPDGIFDMSELGFPAAHGVSAIRAQWKDENAPHPLAHHGTNIVVTENSDGTVQVLSKALGVGYKGRVGSATYRDVLRKTPEGWRFEHRRVILRLPDRIPEPS